MTTKNPFDFLEDHQKVVLFIDGTNTFRAARGLNFDIDYALLKSAISDRCELIRMYYFTASVHNNNDEYCPDKPLLDWISYNGYTLITKPAKPYTDSEGRSRIKGNMDVEIAVHMLRIMDKIDYAILFSGDGDLRALVEEVQTRSTMRVAVASTMKTQPVFIADELRRQADHFIELEDLAPFIKRQPREGARRAQYAGAISESTTRTEEAA